MQKNVNNLFLSFCFLQLYIGYDPDPNSVEEELRRKLKQLELKENHKVVYISKKTL